MAETRASIACLAKQGNTVRFGAAPRGLVGAKEAIRNSGRRPHDPRFRLKLDMEVLLPLVQQVAEQELEGFQQLLLNLLPGFH